MAMCLCLFDDDGQTAVVRKKSLSGTFREGEMCQFVCAVSSVNLKCEILKIADSEDVLNQYELEWQQTPRALEIFKKMSLHGKGGYLQVGNQDFVKKKKPKFVLKRLSAAVKNMYDVKFKRSRKTTKAAITSTKKTPARDPPVVKKQNVKRKLPSLPSATSKRPRKVETPTSQITGTEGRSLNVLFSGGQGEVEVSAEVYPNRSPNFPQHLSGDQQESLMNEISFHVNGKQCASVQTEPVVMASTEAELVESLTLIGFVKKYEERLSRIETSISGLQKFFTEGCNILPPRSEHHTEFPASSMQPGHHQSLSDSLLPMVKNCLRSPSSPEQSSLTDSSPSSVNTGNHRQHLILPLQSDLTDNAPTPMVNNFSKPLSLHLQSNLTDSAPTPVVNNYRQPQSLHLQSDLTAGAPPPLVNNFLQPTSLHLQSDLTDSAPPPMVNNYRQPQSLQLRSDMTDSAPLIIKNYRQPQTLHLQSDLTGNAPPLMVKNYRQPLSLHLQSDLNDSAPTSMVNNYCQAQSLHLQSDLTDSAPTPMVNNLRQPQSLHLQSDLTDSAPTPMVKNYRQPLSLQLQSDLNDSAPTSMVNNYCQAQSLHLQSDLTDSAPTPMVNNLRQPQSLHLQSDLTDSAPTPMVKNYRQPQSLHLQSDLADNAAPHFVKNYRNHSPYNYSQNLLTVYNPWLTTTANNPSSHCSQTWLTMHHP